MRRAIRLASGWSATARSGEALLFVGSRNSGKTTLSTFLVNRGLRYLADDFALIDTRTLKLRPLPVPIRLKAPAFEFDCRRLRLYTCRSGPIYYAVPQPEVLPIRGQCFSIRAVIFPTYAAGRDASLELLAPGRAAFELMSHSYNQPLLQSLGFEAVARLAETAPAYRLDHGDLQRAALALAGLTA